MSRAHRSTIRAIIIGIPARNEARHIARSIPSIFRALNRLDPTTEAYVTVAADHCDDGTEALLQALAGEHQRLRTISGRWGSAGGARRAAIADGLAAVTRADTRSLDDVWVATTDADTVVDPEWLVRQLSYAHSGFDGVAGIVELLHDDDHTPTIASRFADHYRFEATSHPHVHGANLGVRATAYLAAGGFPGIACSEDHALWNELRSRGFACVSPVDVRVSTSARLRSRAPGGFADGLAEVMQ